MNNPISSFQFDGRIKAAHYDHLSQHGVLHFKNFVSPETVIQFLNEIKKVEKHLLTNKITRVNGIPLKYGTDVDGSKIIQRLAFTSQYSETLSRFLRSEKVQSLTNLLQPYDGRIVENEKDGLVVNHYLNADESSYSKLGWHTDSPRDLFLGSRILPMLNVGLHLDDCPYENGGLRVLTGTHSQGLRTLLFKKKYFIDHEPDPHETGFSIAAGDLTIHDGRLWHRVQESPYIGERSRRRVMYIPVITGKYNPRTADSATPFYHQLAQLAVGKLFKRTKKKQPAATAAGLLPGFKG